MEKNNMQPATLSYILRCESCGVHGDIDEFTDTFICPNCRGEMKLFEARLSGDDSSIDTLLEQIIDSAENGDVISKRTLAFLADSPNEHTRTAVGNVLYMKQHPQESTSNSSLGISYDEYHLPSPLLLDSHDETNQENKAYIQSAIEKLETTLSNFRIGGTVSDVTIGPRFARFEITLDSNVKVKKILDIQDNIAMALETRSIHVQTVIPGKNAVGIEVPNKVSTTVYLRPLLESATWKESLAAVPILLGCDMMNKVAMFDLADASPLLIAGCTGSGKSVCMNNLILSLLFRFSPEELKLIMIDPKVIELDVYRPIPHLIMPVVNDSNKASLALRWAVNELYRRYMVLAKVRAKNIVAFNSRPPEPLPVTDDFGVVIPPKLPFLVVIINELSDLMLSDQKEEVEQSIFHLTQKGHDAGIHLVVMTSALRKDVVSDHIKSNVRSKVVLRVSDIMSSRVVMDKVGAEKLLGNGDMLFLPPNEVNPERIQGAYVSDQEIEKVIDEVAAQRMQTFDDGVFACGDDDEKDDELDDYDESEGMANADVIMAAAKKYLLPSDPPIMVRALEIIINERQISTSYLQRRLGIGYNMAADIIDKLEQRRIISAPLPGEQKRAILI